MDTFALCQTPSGEPHEIEGALRSTLKLYGPAVAQLLALSQTWCVPVGALASSEPLATLVVSEKVASPEFARPDPLSLEVQLTVTSAPYQTD
jgi:hypothetical protein